jgi:fatty acid desaturase
VSSIPTDTLNSATRSDAADPVGFDASPSNVTGAGVEVPTLIVATLVYGSFLLITWFYASLPLWFAAPALGLLLAWYSSLQHETIHDHPTRSRRVNSKLACAPLSLWIPYGIYRITHLQHHRHRGRHLTDIDHDPESFYRLPGRLSKAGALRRAVYSANCTLAGRLMFGPALALRSFWTSEARRLRAGDRARRLIWTRHLFGVGLVLAWVAGVCHIPLWIYATLVVYPSISLTHLRSFAEHRAHAESHSRTTVVESNFLWALIFLNNNLHITHHAYPKMPWYRLPAAWRSMRGSVLESGLVYRGGYAEVMGRYLFRPVISVEHPLLGGRLE